MAILLLRSYEGSSRAPGIHNSESYSKLQNSRGEVGKRGHLASFNNSTTPMYIYLAYGSMQVEIKMWLSYELILNHRYSNEKWAKANPKHLDAR